MFRKPTYHQITQGALRLCKPLMIGMCLFLASTLNAQNKLRFIQVQHAAGRDSVKAFCDDVIAFLRANSPCLCVQFKEKKLDVSFEKVFYDPREINNQGMYKKGFLEALHYQAYTRIRGTENLLRRNCIATAAESPSTQQSFSSAELKLHFSEVLSDGRLFYIQAKFSKKDVSVIIYASYSSPGHLAALYMEEVIY